MLSTVPKSVTLENTISLPESGRLLPRLPEFVSKIGLEIINNSFLSFPGVNDKEYGINSSAGCSFIEELCHLRRHGDYEISLDSTCFLHGLLQQVVSLNNLIQLAKTEIQTPSFQGQSFAKKGKGITLCCLQYSQL